MTPGRRVVVTGASGFIGRRLLEAMPGSYSVIAASRSGGDIDRWAGAYLDVRDAGTFENLPSRVDAVVHLAALIDAPNADEYNATNVIGTRHVLEYAARAGAETFVYGSTGGVYGSSPTPSREQEQLRPQDDYAVSKAQAELLVQAFDTKMSKIILRYCAPYAFGTPNPISRVIESVIRGREIDVSAGMYPRYNPLHLSDAVEMSVRALALGSGCVLNIAGEEVTTFAGIALTAGLALGRSPRFRLVELEQTIPYYRSDTFLEPTAAYEHLGYRPQVRLKDGITEMAHKQADRANVG
jgi:nucleoside-diphosphate-sugar epimerase